MSKRRTQRQHWVARNPGSNIGLLFTRMQTYEERMWQRAYDAAIASGAQVDDARRVADDAAMEAKGAITPTA
jgi:hypothetical protein